jgi:hypothetical protein
MGRSPLWDGFKYQAQHLADQPCRWGAGAMQCAQYRRAGATRDAVLVETDGIAKRAPRPVKTSDSIADPRD